MGQEQAKPSVEQGEERTQKLKESNQNLASKGNEELSEWEIIQTGPVRQDVQNGAHTSRDENFEWATIQQLTMETNYPDRKVLVPNIRRQREYRGAAKPSRGSRQIIETEEVTPEANSEILSGAEANEEDTVSDSAAVLDSNLERPGLIALHARLRKMGSHFHMYKNMEKLYNEAWPEESYPQGLKRIQRVRDRLEAREEQVMRQAEWDVRRPGMKSLHEKLRQFPSGTGRENLERMYNETWPQDPIPQSIMEIVSRLEVREVELMGGDVESIKRHYAVLRGSVNRVKDKRGLGINAVQKTSKVPFNA